MFNEIGSDFWLYEAEITTTQKEIPKWLNFGSDIRFLLSGRTAIDYVLEDIQKKIEIVYMPSYCCDSILKPFHDRNIKIEFYEVAFINGKPVYSINQHKRCDIFLAMSYFGFSCTKMDAAINSFIECGVTVIEDITHRLLSEEAHGGAEYSIASLRKWFALPAGGVAIKKKGKFKKQLLKDGSALVGVKISAMKKKAEYLNKLNKNEAEHDYEKLNFLSAFHEFEKKLESDYRSLKIDKISQNLLLTIDIDFIRQIRRKNAYYLYEKLRNNLNVKPLICEFNFSNDCPLFIPVTIDADLRDGLQHHLASKAIYCPVHWPLSVHHDIYMQQSSIYRQSISLICDQRYDINDMKRIADTIRVYMEKRG